MKAIESYERDLSCIATTQSMIDRTMPKRINALDGRTLSRIQARVLGRDLPLGGLGEVWPGHVQLMEKAND